MKKIISLLLAIVLLFAFSSVNVSVSAEPLEEALELQKDTVTFCPNQMVLVEVYCPYAWERIVCDIEDKSIVEIEIKPVDSITNLLCIYGLKVGKTDVKVSSYVGSKEAGRQYITINCVEPIVNVEDVVINLDEENSKNITVGLTSDVSSDMEVKIKTDNENVIGFELGSFENNEQEVTINAKTEGVATLSVEFYDKNTEKVFASKDTTVTVHKHNVVEDLAVDATCTKDGLTKGSHCSSCNKVFVNQSVISAVGHKTIVTNAKEATYFEKGYIGDTVCSVCKEVVEKGKSVGKLVLKTPKIKLTKGKKQFKVKYTKTTDATGFQVRYKAKGGWKIKTFNTKKTVTKVIKKLKAGNYKVQVRVMTKQGSKKAYSNWTKAQNVKVK